MRTERNDRVGFAERARLSQQAVRAALKPEYDSSFADRGPGDRWWRAGSLTVPQSMISCSKRAALTTCRPEVIQWSS